MKSRSPGRSTSEVEVTDISKHGFWLLLRKKELFLPFRDFPWFKKAPVSAILNVELLDPSHLYWPDLDVDLDLDSLLYPEKYPLISKGS